ncbi:MAG: ABC transporter permease [Acidimicrobiales bacterium]
MGILAENTSIFDERILDQWEIPVGQWVDQAVDWINNNMSHVLDVIRWPFQFLFDNVVQDILLSVSWVWIVVAFFVVGTLVRGVKVGVMAATALTLCGFLGSGYWTATMESVGLILVSVFLCAVIGIPLGILCGRVNSVWQVVRPVLDAMQVIHPFVFMLPVIFFFGFREVPATMGTMIFALPPLVRLTNLGIRQVPEDVVEASRSFGAPEFKVLTDVQLPLARPAIMTGLNQTLLLAISMGGIAAIMGAAGLGLLIFRAVSNLDVGLAGSAGLAYFIVAVVLDRISQPEDSDGASLFGRLRAARSHRKDPEALLEAPGFARPAAAPKAGAGAFTALLGPERTAAGLVGAGSIVAIIGVFLNWSNDSGLISGYARSEDLDLAGRSFNGINAAGGSFYGILVLVAAAFALLAAVWSLLATARGSNWLNAAGATMAGGAVAITALSFLFAQTNPLAVAYSHGPGVYLAVVGGLVIFAAGWYWAWQSPIAELRPVPQGIGWGRFLGGLAAVALMAISVYSGWSFDQRAETVITPEIQAELDEVRRKADTGELAANIAAQEIQRITNSAVAAELIVTDGISEGGPQLAFLPMALAVIGVCALGLASGMSRSRLKNAVHKFKTAESDSGREPMMVLGLVGALVSLLWVYPVDRLGPFLLDFRIPALYRPVGGLGDLFGEWEVQYIGGEWIEAFIMLAIAVLAVRWAVKAEEIADKAVRMLAIGVAGVAIFLAVLAWRHGLLASIYVVAAVAIPVAVGLLTPRMTSRHQWTWATLAGGLGLGMMALATGWVFSVLRVADAKYFSGIGAFLTFTAGFVLFVSARGLLGYFGRRKVYDEITNGAQTDYEELAESAETVGSEPAAALAGR